MVGKRRFGLLMAAVVFGVLVLWARLFQVQVVEHEVWATQAANLVRSASLLPFHRGRIVDCKDRLVAYDDDYYQVELDYREFRRGHPLGQVAHARSSLEQRAVGLDEALTTLEDWAFALCDLTPNGLAGFARGELLQHERFELPGCENPVAERRGPRAADIHYYSVKLLLEKDPGGRMQRKIWRTRGEPAGNRSFVDLVARERKTTPEQVREDLTRRLRDARSDLGRLGAQLDYGFETGEEPLLALVADLEGARRKVEDGIADELFREAARFAPGRIETDSLQRFDLRWIAGMLSWDDARLSEWIVSRRPGWLAWVREFGLYRGLLQVDLSYDVGDPAQRVLSELANLFAAEPRYGEHRVASDWRTVNDLACLRELPDLFDVPDSVRLMSGASFHLPFQTSEARASARDPVDPWQFYADVVFAPGGHSELLTEDGEPWIPPATAVELAARWRAQSEVGRLHGLEALRLGTLNFHSFEALLQEEIRRRLDLLVENSVEAQETGLAFSESRRSIALKKARHIIRDQSSRPALVARDPEYPVVQLVTRWHERFAGIEVRTRTRRHYPAVDENGTPLASGLLGSVREANLREVLSQRGRLRELRELQRKRERTEVEDLRVLELASMLHHPEEHHGSDGIEGYLHEELRGENGYVETQGIEERMRSGGIELFELPVNGKDVKLTLDLDLQAAAQQVLEHPVLPNSEDKRDTIWFDNPVGAIVLVTPEGDVLAAASVPTRDEEAPMERDGERGVVRERCLTRPQHQPPGSVFKPFVALWALENLNWSADELTNCGALEGGGAGYESMHCHRSIGHGEIDLHTAIQQSCNAYFARLGETYSKHELQFMADKFGFGQPTGILSLDGERSGLREDSTFQGFDVLDAARNESIENRMKRQIGNGLSLVEATPAQVARATCGLLTNALPNLRLIREIDGVEQPQEIRDLGFSGENLMRVHVAMDSVVNESGGSAYSTIGLSDLPFRVAGKTGSADYRRFKPGTNPEGQNRANRKTRKHTWFAGWFPAEDPRAVLVVYLHDVAETSSHTSVHVATQFMESPAVLSFVGAE